MGADRSFPAGGSWFWPCVGSRRPDFRRCFWRCLRNGDYRRDATFFRASIGSAVAIRALLICAVGIISKRLEVSPQIRCHALRAPGLRDRGSLSLFVYRRVPNQAASAALVSWPRRPLRRRCCGKSRPARERAAAGRGASPKYFFPAAGTLIVRVVSSLIGCYGWILFL